ncbi:MAG: 3-dehydroquinate synthase [Bacteroidales bacterium]|nr:3-dehydroquinate synthase [Bacteroidales bacterium]
MKEQQVIFTNDICEALHKCTDTIHHDSLFMLFDTNTMMYCMPLITSFMNEYDEAHPSARIHTIIIRSSDTAKNIETLTEVWQSLSDNHATRHSLLINVGGGMVTDLGGFAAASFKRGIKFINVPTSLLGAVDAAVGGKTGINFGNIKNEIGVFALASAVIVSTKFFESLDKENLLSGYAEMLKHGILSNEEHFNNLLAFDITNINAQESKDKHYAQLLALLETSVNVKRTVVRQDPYEEGLRKALNLGHTFGHAFETWAMRQGKPVLHGYAVAWGLVCELIMSHQQIGLNSEILYKVASFVKDNYGSLYFTCDDYEDFLELMKHDKKNQGDTINFSLMRHIGDVALNQIANKEQIGVVLDIYRDLMGI